MITEFLDLLENCASIKHLFIPIRLSMGKTELFYFSNNSEDIKIFRKGVVDNTYRYIDFTPHEIGFSIQLDKDDKK